jgi:hypothetical protein
MNKIFHLFSVEGLNFDFLLLNVIGHSSYLVYNLGFYFSPTVQVNKNIFSFFYSVFFYSLKDEYFSKPMHAGGINPVLLNDVFFSFHATIITILTIYQCSIYDVIINSCHFL